MCPCPTDPLKSRRAPAECLVSTLRKYTKWALGIEESGEGGFKECAVGFNQTLSESLFEDRNGKFTIVSRANSNPQVFRLNLLNFLNAAPYRAPMLPLAIIYKVSHALNFLVKKILFPQFFNFLFFSLQGGVVWIVVRSPLGEYSGSNFFEMAKLSTRGR